MKEAHPEVRIVLVAIERTGSLKGVLRDSERES